MPTNFYVQYLAALDVIILAEGGTVPTVAPLNFQQADIARLDALVAAVDGDAPPVTLNYRSATIARWRAAITGLSGTLPTVWVNFEQAMVLHVQALQSARGVSTAIAGQNFQETLLGLLAAASAFDPDASTWFAAVEDTGATFGPDAATIATNKTAWSNWVIAQKNAASPITGRTNWQQLTQAGEGYIQPMMGVSTFNVPPLFGESTFTGFVIGDHVPAQGLKGGSEKVLLSNRHWNAPPINDVSAGMWVTELGGSGTARVWGTATSVSQLAETPFSRLNSTAFTIHTGNSYAAGSFPRPAFASRHQSGNYLVWTDTAIQTISATSNTQSTVNVSFFNNELNTAPSTVRAGLAWCGRSIDLTAMRDAFVALSEAIVWP